VWDFARRPAWIVSHVLVVVGVCVLVGLGLWQRARYLEETDRLERIEARASSPPVPVEEVLPPATAVGDLPASAEFTRVSAAGTWDPAGEVYVRNRSYNGAPGSWVLTPLVLADGNALAVVRGWIPNVDPDPPGPPFPGAEPPGGPVEIAGVVQLNQTRSSLGAADPAGGRLEVLNRVDLERLGEQLPYPLLPGWVLLDAQDPKQTTPLPSRVGVEVPSAGQNLSYMFQWWLFAAIAAGGYVLVLRRHARTRAAGGETPVEDHPDLPTAVVGPDAGSVGSGRGGAGPVGG
jgi:cytochrome oxidase assembly protein ShyY1